MWFSPRTSRGPEIVRPRRGSRRSRPVVESLEARYLLSASSPDPFQPTAAEQYMLALINRARANPAAEGARLLAIARSDPVIAAATTNLNLDQFSQVMSSFGPEPPLAMNTALVEAARDHNAAMLAANSQFHSPTGYLNNSQVATADDGQAYYPTGTYGWSTGENIFAYSGGVPAGSSDQAYVDYFEAAFFLDWGNPDFGHLRNLLAPGPGEAAPGTSTFSEIGVGLLTGVRPSAPPAANSPIAANAGLNVGPDLITEELGWRSGNAMLTGVVYADRDRNQFYTPGEGLGSVTIRAVGREGEGTFQTQTWDSGGYSLPLPPGTYDVTASGGNLPAPQGTTITIGKDNVPWDVAPTVSGGVPAGTSPAVSPGGAGPTAQSVAGVNLIGGVSSPHARAAKKRKHPIHPRGPLLPLTLRAARRRHAIQVASSKGKLWQ